MSKLPKYLLKKLNKHLKFDGYTLIEILIGIVILSILFGIGFAGFRDFSRRQSLEVLARKVKGDLALIREKAISGEKPIEAVCSSPTNTLSGYSFSVINNKTYTISAICSGGNILVKQVEIPENLTISTPLPNPILFMVLSKGTNVSAETDIVVSQEESGMTFTITVTQTGEIK